MLCRPNLPGPTNQKSVPGLWQLVVEPLPVTCSVSSPRAIGPLAVTTTPPSAGSVGTDGPLGAGEALAWCLGTGGAFTPASVSVPGWLTVTTGCPLVSPSRVTDDCPDPADPLVAPG